jgi:glycosyltransferase involved in cell wall biosynthesis
VITVVFNARDTIENCIQSVLKQRYEDVEYIVIDGGSTDGTVEIIEKYSAHISAFLSERDNGIYDAMNKGIRLSKGDIVGTLNADDILADNEILSLVASSFLASDCSVVYGDLLFVNAAGRTVRRWTSKQCNSASFNFGFMPPHPTFYCRRTLFSKFGFYNINYGSASDYELMLRFMHLNNLKSCYLNKVMINMRIGGTSNRSFKNRFKAWTFDLKAMQKNKVKIPLLALIMKPVRKVIQFIRL